MGEGVMRMGEGEMMRDRGRGDDEGWGKGEMMRDGGEVDRGG